MAEWTQRVLHALPSGGDAISPHDLYAKIAADYTTIDESLIDDVVFLMVQSGDLRLTRDLRVERV